MIPELVAELEEEMSDLTKPYNTFLKNIWYFHLLAGQKFEQNQTKCLFSHWYPQVLSTEI